MDTNYIIKLYDQSKYEKILKKINPVGYKDMRRKTNVRTKVLLRVLYMGYTDLFEYLYTTHATDFDHYLILQKIFELKLESELKIFIAYAPKVEFPLPLYEEWQLIPNLNQFHILIEAKRADIIDIIIRRAIKATDLHTIEYALQNELDVTELLVDMSHHIEINLQMIELVHPYVTTKKSTYVLCTNAIHQSNLSTISYFIENEFVDINYLSQVDFLSSSIEVIRYLLKFGLAIDVNPSCILERSTAEAIELIGLLEKNGFDPMALVNEFMLSAVENSDNVLAQWFLDSGADIHYFDEVYLFYAILYSDVEMTDFLLTAGADIHAFDDCIIYIAIAPINVSRYVMNLMYEQWFNTSMFEIMSRYGIRNPPDPDIFDCRIIKILLRFGAKIPPDCTLANFIYHNTKFSMDVELFQMLIDYGIDPNVPIDTKIIFCNTKLSTVLELFLYMIGSADITKLLMQSGADVNSHGGLPLALAVESGDITVIKLLLECGAYINPTYTIAVEQEIIDLFELYHINHILCANKV